MWRVCRDSLLLDCVPLSQGSQVAECFVEGLQVVDECKPANGTGSSLKDLLASGAATDGDEGSLCSLVPTEDMVSSPAVFGVDRGHYAWDGRTLKSLMSGTPAKR